MGKNTVLDAFKGKDLSADMRSPFLSEGNHVLRTKEVSLRISDGKKTSGLLLFSIDAEIVETDSTTLKPGQTVTSMLIRREEQPYFFNIDLENTVMAILGTNIPLSGGGIEQAIEDGVLDGRLVNARVFKETGNNGNEYTRTVFTANDSEGASEFIDPGLASSGDELAAIIPNYCYKIGLEKIDDVTIKAQSYRLESWAGRYGKETRAYVIGEVIDCPSNPELVGTIGAVNRKQTTKTDTSAVVLGLNIIAAATGISSSEMAGKAGHELLGQLLAGEIKTDEVKLRKTQTKARSKQGYEYNDKTFTIL